jgi:hypothetical protein
MISNEIKPGIAIGKAKILLQNFFSFISFEFVRMARNSPLKYTVKVLMMAHRTVHIAIPIKVSFQTSIVKILIKLSIPTQLMRLLGGMWYGLE